jgi:hypothetical protein
VVNAAGAPPPPPPTSNIPTLSQWGLVLLVVLLGIVAAWRVRARGRR